MPKLLNQSALEYYKIHLLVNTNNKEYLKQLKNKSINEVFAKWNKEKEIGQEIFKSIATIDKNLTGDCDDFTTIISYILKNVYNKSEVYALFFIKNNACYHVAPGYIENGKLHIIDVYKFKKAVNSFDIKSKDVFKYYFKAQEIKQFKINDVVGV